MRLRTPVAVSLALLLATSGCASFGVLGGNGDASPPDEDVAEQFAELETLEATQVSNMDAGNATNQSRVLVRADFTEPVRQYQRVLAPDERAGNRVVVNESASIIYDASDNAVTRVPRSTQMTVERGEYYASIVAAARENETVDAPDIGVSPLPVIPAEGPTASVPTDDIAGYSVEYLGTDTVAGRDVLGFRMTPASEAAIDITQTLWLDAEYYYPLKSHQTARLGNDTYEVRMHLENVSFNVDLPGDAFSFDPPENATVETLNVSTRTFDSRAALDRATELSLPDPEIPDGYEFDRGQRFGENVTQVNLQYTNGEGDRLTVTKMDYVSNGSGGLGSGENVTVAGRDARYLTTGQANLLSWSCEETQYSVVATGLDKEQVVAVAESVACE